MIRKAEKQELPIPVRKCFLGPFAILSKGRHAYVFQA